MRSLLILIAALLATPAQAQRVFRASSLDQEQNERLDKHDQQIATLTTRMETLEQSAAVRGSLSESVSDPVPDAPAELATLGEPAEEPSEPASVRPSPQPERFTTSQLRRLIQQVRPGGWQGPVYADVEPRSAVKSHLLGPEHRFNWPQVQGLTNSEALILHDVAPNHGNLIFPTRTEQSRAHSRGRPSKPARKTQQAAAPERTAQPQSAGCANGQCPTSQSLPQSSGFPVFRRFFR